jgi:hypothetical protein
MEPQRQSGTIYREVSQFGFRLTVREVRIWDVKKLQIQSELLVPSSKEILDISVDGYKGILYTLISTGVSPIQASLQ